MITLISSGYYPDSESADLGQLTRSLAQYWAGNGSKVTVLLPLIDPEHKSKLRPYSKRVRLKYEGKTKDYNIWTRQESPHISLFYIEKNLFFGDRSSDGDKVNGSEGNLFFNYAVVNTMKLFDGLPNRVIALGWQAASAVAMIRYDDSFQDVSIHYLDFGSTSLPIPDAMAEIAAKMNQGALRSFSELGTKLASPIPPDYPVWSIAVLSKLQPSSEEKILTI